MYSTLTPDGRAVVAWHASTSHIGATAVAAWKPPGGTWSAATALSSPTRGASG